MLTKEVIGIPQAKGPRALIDRVVNRIFTPGWEEYNSISGHPELTREVFQDNPLIVVHPGFLGYWPLVDKSKLKHDAYNDYLRTLKETVDKALKAKRRVFVFSPNEYLERTVELFGDNKKELILVPTMGNTSAIDELILGLSSGQFFEAMGSYVNRAEICGEQGSICVTGVAEKLEENGVEVTFLKQVTVN